MVNLSLKLSYCSANSYNSANVELSDLCTLDQENSECSAHGIAQYEPGWPLQAPQLHRHECEDLPAHREYPVLFVIGEY